MVSCLLRGAGYEFNEGIWASHTAGMFVCLFFLQIHGEAFRRIRGLMGQTLQNFHLLSALYRYGGLPSSLRDIEIYRYHSHLCEWLELLEKHQRRSATALSIVYVHLQDIMESNEMLSWRRSKGPCPIPSLPAIMPPPRGPSIRRVCKSPVTVPPLVLALALALTSPSRPGL